jgi:hypothetical protein
MAVDSCSGLASGSRLMRAGEKFTWPAIGRALLPSCWHVRAHAMVEPPVGRAVTYR